MIYTIRKKLQLLFKKFTYGLFKLFYGKIEKSEKIGNNSNSSVKISKVDKDFEYKVYAIKNARLYTDTINDTAIIQNNKIIDGPSFQIRNVKFENVDKNIVFTKGTPRFKIKLKGNLFSLLTGGGGNYNYWHWMFDVLPRLKILMNIMDVNEIDNFLFPNLEKKYQKESLDLIGIPKKKRISSINIRHIECREIFVTDHPYVIKNQASEEIQNMPLWIINWIKESLSQNIKYIKTINYPKKIYIDRSDATSNQSSMRKIINDNEIKETLEEKGFTSIKLSFLTLEEQIKIFQNAEIIVGLHGGGFANMIFCQPETKIIELKSVSAGDVILNLAEKCNLKYDTISKVPEQLNQNNQLGFIRVEKNEILKKL